MSGIPCANPSKKSDEVKPMMIDLRSDTVTQPTPEMRRAMAEAIVGDDVYGEDPTINRLEQRAAEIFGREASIFVPTGSMGNQIAIKLHTRPGQDIICEERGHIFNYEMSTLATFSGCLVRPVAAPDGIVTWDLIRTKLSPKIYYMAQTGLISLENTHNMAGGAVMPSEVMDDICDRAHELGLPVHLDGARIFNAAAYLGKPVAELTRKFDSVMFCLSKGLGAPVGSMLVGTAKFIEQARTVRKALGGGMRQAGILAAAGLIALEKGPARLHLDHENAKFLAEGLAQIPGVKIDPTKVQSNIVIFDVSGTGITSAEISKKLAERNVLANGVNSQLVRFVTHCDVDRAGCEQALNAMQAICEAKQLPVAGRQ
ncbi:MAG TPA: low specificity L-threonine aldolase [Clostridia bacterium]|nr:low specificity L-threonine aldolase [Clostridia bacterium]